MSAFYGDLFYQTMRDGSDRSASVVVPLVIDLVRPASVVDVGCGTGAWLARFQEHGVQDVLGLECSEVSAHLTHLDRSRIRIVDVSQPFRLEREFDLVLSLEVAEHLSEESAAWFVQSLVQLGPVVLFSAAVPYQGGVGHLNEQWPSYWVRHFADNGFTIVDCLRDRIWRDERVEWWYRQNLLVFVRNNLLSQYAARQAHAGPMTALDRMMPYALRHPIPSLKPPKPPDSFGVIVLSKNGAGRIEHCLQSIVQSNLTDNIVVFVDQDTTDSTAEIARQFTSQVHPIKTQGNIESVLPQMASLCSAEYLLRIDDDETLGGDWNRSRLEALLRFNDLTHVMIPRRWLIPPGALFIANEPWFPDFQVRFFRNDPNLIRWPALIHDPMVITGRGLVLFDRWLDHHDLIVRSRPEREHKCQYYRSLRPEKHCSHFYLYEEQELDLLPTDTSGFTAAVEGYISSRESRAVEARPYQPGSEIRFECGGNSMEYTREGWSDPESWGTWTSGYRAELRLTLQEPFQGPAVLMVEAGAYVNVNHPALRVRVVCGREPIGEWSVEVAEPVERSLAIPASAITAKEELLLAFYMENPASPAAFGESGDQRLLGLGVRKLRLLPIGL